MKIGIDLISFHAPAYYHDLRTLAEKRGVFIRKKAAKRLSRMQKSVW